MVRECKKCGVIVDTVGEHCPLCNAKIGPNSNPTYPTLETKSTWLFIKRLLFFFVFVVTIGVTFLNYMLTPGTKWSVFVIAGILSMYVIFLGIVKGHKRILSMMFYMCFLVMIITFLWDKMFGFMGWSVNYVMPSLAISYGVFLIVLRFVSHLRFEDNSLYIYLHVLFEFLPMILYYFGFVTFKPLTLISAGFGFINLFILIFFDFSHLKRDVAMRLHI